MMTWDYDKAQLLAKVNDLRDIDMLLSFATFPNELHSEYDRILKQTEAKAWAITEQLFPEATLDEYELVALTPNSHAQDLMALLSPAWWMQIDAAVAKL